MPGFVFQTNHAHFQRRRPAFTLAEMLAVMGILTILLVVTVPAFRGLNQGGARRAAVNNLMGMLDHARTLAVSDGKATYVVFYASGTQVSGAQTDVVNGPWGRAYALYEDHDNVSFNPEQKTPWTYLPAGMAFKVDSQIPSVTNKTPDGTFFPVSPAFATGGATTLQLPYWKFDNTGAIAESTLNGNSSNATYLRVLMFPGSLKADGTEAATQQGASGSNLVAATLEEVDLNPVTGRAKYIVNPADNLVTPTPSSSPQS